MELNLEAKYASIAGVLNQQIMVSAEGKKALYSQNGEFGKGMPFVEPALDHLKVVIEEARRVEIDALTIIHGYGSSGKGGVIRKECRSLLDYMCSIGELTDYVTGEDFHRRNGLVKNLLNRFPQLSTNKNLNKNNRGITLVIL